MLLSQIKHKMTLKAIIKYNIDDKLLATFKDKKELYLYIKKRGVQLVKERNEIYNKQYIFNYKRKERYKKNILMRLDRQMKSLFE